MNSKTLELLFILFYRNWYKYSVYGGPEGGTWKGDLNEPRYVAVDTKLGVLLNFEIRDSSFEFQVWSFESRVSSSDFLNQCSISIVVVALLKG